MEMKDKDTVEFHYDRDRRLENAGPNARFAHSLHGGVRMGFIKSLTATPWLRFLFYTIVLALAATVIADRVNASRNRGVLSGIRYELEALWFEGEVYLTLQRSGTATLPPVDLAVTVGGRVTGMSLRAGEDEYRAKADAPEKPSWIYVTVDDGAMALDLAVRVK